MSSPTGESNKKPFISDYTLYRRLKDFLKEQDDPKSVDKEDLVESFRLKYKEYGRRQKSAFRALLLRTYKVALENLDSDDTGPGKSHVSSTGPPGEEDSSMSLTSEDADPSEGNSQLAGGGSAIGDEAFLLDTIDAAEGTYVMTPDGKDPFLDDDDDDDEDGEIDVGCQTTSSSQAPVSYLQSLHKMTNSSKASSNVITVISSDEGSDDQMNGEIQKIQNRFHTAGQVSIQRINNIGGNRSYLPSYAKKLKILKRKADEDPTHSSKKVKVSSVNLNITIPSITFAKFGGFSRILQAVSELVVHLKEAKIYEELGAKPPRGFLLHGPPGSGKTLLAQAIAGELEVPLLRINGPEIVAGVSGESEAKIRELFEAAAQQAPIVLFIDEIDAICPPRETARREMERRIVAQLLTCIDGLGEVEGGDRVVLIGATNRPDALDPALRRAGRFDREVCLGIPDREARKGILEVVTEGMKLRPGLDFKALAAATPGFVGADIKALASEAAIAAVNRCLEAEKNKIQSDHKELGANDSIIVVNESVCSEKMESSKDEKTSENGNLESSTNDVEMSDASDANKNNEENSKKPSESVNDSTSNSEGREIKENRNKNDFIGLAYLLMLRSKGSLLSQEQLKDLFIEEVDFMKALKSVQPSAKREGFATVPDVTWDDIGSLRDIRAELEKSIMMPVKYPTEFALLGIDAPSGILLCGPPGCGKTLLAKAVANEAHINFISVKGPELLNMYVGESERAVRQCFQRARNSQPCVIFFDEIDALCPTRGSSVEGSNATSRVVNQVLTEMDGVEGRQGVFLMAATNRPDMVDPAVLRPGRLDKILYVGLPSPSDRADILRALTRNGTKPPMKDVDFEAIGKDARLDGYTGADLAALVKEASLLALTDYISKRPSSGVSPPERQEGALHVTADMVHQAANKIRPSVTPVERQHYEDLKKIYGF